MSLVASFARIRSGMLLAMRQRLTILLVTIALLAAAALVATPLAWMVIRSLREPGPGIHGGSFTFGNYLQLLRSQSTAMWLSNSLLLVSLQTLLGCFAAALAGHVLAHHRFAWRKPLLGIVLLSMLLPGQVTLPATWRLLHQMNLLNTYIALLLPAAGTAFGAMLFRHACQQIPSEMLDAARIDGCSEWRTWWEIVLPVIQPTLVTFAVLSFTANWNAYLWPQIVLQDERKYTLAMGLANMASMPQQRELGLMLAATTISILPAFALFLIARQSLQESLTEGAIR